MIKDEVLKHFSGKNVVVTGGTGLIGREIVRLLADNGAKVKVVSLDKIVVHPKASHVYGDLSDFGFCKEVTSGMDAVFHVAGVKGSIEVTKAKPASFFVPLLMMNTNMLEASRINKVERVVYTSSIGAYGSSEVFKEDEDSEETPPMDMFPGWAKRMAEMQVKAYAIQYGLKNFAVTRPCNVYGPGDNFDPANAMVIPSLMSRVKGGENPLKVWGDGSAVRDFAFSTDVAEGVILACYHGTRGSFVNLGSGVGVTVRQLVETLAKVTPFDFEFDATKGAGFPRRVMDITRAGEWIEYNPTTTLLEGLKKTWEWYLANSDEHLKKVNYFR